MLKGYLALDWIDFSYVLRHDKVMLETGSRSISLEW
jgi:hypothetical protein